LQITKLTEVDSVKEVLLISMQSSDKNTTVQVTEELKVVALPSPFPGLLLPPGMTFSATPGSYCLIETLATQSFDLPWR
jgi:hypothetical protein